MGSYTMDSHNVQRYITPDGRVQNEGDIGVGTNGPYQIALGSIQPKKQQCENLLVPVCVSSSHIAFGSIRMEPVFMILGQSAATVAAMAIENEQAVQDVVYEELRERLLAEGQVLEAPEGSLPKASLPAAKLPGLVIDDAAAKLTGNWGTSAAIGPFVEFGYRHDGNENKGKMKARFEVKPDAGRYELRLYCSPSSNRATNVPVIVHHSAGQDSIIVNQQKPGADDVPYAVLGVFSFDGRATVIVEVGNAETDGYVILDAVQFVPRP